MGHPPMGGWTEGWATLPVMRRLGIGDVASLDEHFAVIRFGPKRRQAFHVIR
jgi:hypothetical protein